MKFEINIRHKKTHALLKQVEVENDSTSGILLKGKTKAKEQGFIFNGKTQNVSYNEL